MPGPVRARPHRRRGRARDPAEAAGADRERGVGRARARRRATITIVLDPDRRLDQLLARHLVLGDLDLRARRRRPARRARREPGDRRAHDGDPRRGRVPRRRAAAARRTSTRVEEVGDRARRATPSSRLPWKQFRALGCACADAVRRRRGRARRPHGFRRRTSRRGTISAVTSRASKRARSCATRTEKSS